jgi:hypothetical protein
MYHDRTAWRCAFFVGKKYGSKGYPQGNAAHMGTYKIKALRGKYIIPFACNIKYSFYPRNTSVTPTNIEEDLQ